MGDQEKSTPRYAQIRNHIKHQIDRGILKPGDQIPTETELTAQFQVSRITIKTALKYLVDEGLLIRIAGKGTFVSSGEGQGSRQDWTADTEARKIGIIMPPIGDDLSIHLFRGLEEACHDEGLMPMVKCVVSQREERFAIRDMLALGAEGLILFPADGEAYSEEILKLKSDGVPFVLVDRYLPGIPTNAVCSDNYQGGRAGTDYLAGLGHRHIGILSSPKSKTSSSEDRFLGYLDSAKSNQLKIEPNYWLTRIDEVSHQDEDTTREMVGEWLRNETEMTAVFAFSARTALYVAQAAVRMGKSIPGDLAIICFDDPQIRDLEQDYFTWIEQNFELMGAEAVKLLMKAIRDPATLEKIVLPVALREGRSTAAGPRV